MRHGPTTRPHELSLLYFGALLVACRGGSDTPIVEDGGPLVTGITGFTFRPGSYGRDCSRDDECVVVQPITSCSRCCGMSAVRRDPAERDLAAVERACAGPDAPPNERCAMGCGEHRAACFEQTCVTVPPDGGL